MQQKQQNYLAKKRPLYYFHKNSSYIMQINTDLSPVYSPKSNVSSSFTSPKDPLLPALNFNQIRQQNLGNHPLDSQLPKQSFPKNEKSPTNSGFPVVNNQNQTTTTNESFSIEKNTYLGMRTRKVLKTNFG